MCDTCVTEAGGGRGILCPHCGSTDLERLPRGFKCNACGKGLGRGAGTPLVCPVCRTPTTSDGLGQRVAFTKYQWCPTCRLYPEAVPLAELLWPYVCPKEVGVVGE